MAHHSLGQAKRPELQPTGLHLDRIRQRGSRQPESETQEQAAT
jgi:hypothetical protein